MADNFGLVLDFTVKMSLVLGLTFLGTFVVRRAAASVRQVAWNLAFSGALLLPLLAMVLPGWQTQWLPSSWLSFGARSMEPLALSCAAFLHPKMVDWFSILGDLMLLSLGADSLAALAFRIWWIVLAVLVLRAVLGNVVLFYSFDRAGRFEGLEDMLAEAAEQMGLRRVPQLAIGDFPMPATFGFFSPRIVLPEDALHWSEERLRAVLLHEMAHIKYGDYPFNLIAEFVCALLWFNPMAWYAASQLRMEREKAADDRVLHVGPSRIDYARHLYEIALVCRSGGFGSASAVAMAHHSALKQRVSCILDPNQDRGQLSLKRMVFSGLFFLVLMSPIAAMQPSMCGGARKPCPEKVVEPACKKARTPCEGKAEAAGAQDEGSKQGLCRSGPQLPTP